MNVKLVLASAVLFAVGISAALALTPYRSITLTAGAAPLEAGEGLFIVKCNFSHRLPDDPIVFPGRPGLSHLHTFSGSRTTKASSTYDSMVTSGTSCSHPGDTAGYWVPTLLRPDGTPVTPKFTFGYYKNVPVSYSTTRAFPPDFRIIAGGVQAASRAFWKCFNVGSQHDSSPPACTGSKNWLVSHVDFPSCWNGVLRDSPDHRSHMSYPKGGACPSAYPIKLPRIGFNVRWCENCGGPGWKFSDGTTILHADFWNTWKQSALEDLVRRCLNAGVNCGQVTG